MINTQEKRRPKDFRVSNTSSYQLTSPLHFSIWKANEFILFDYLDKKKRGDWLTVGICLMCRYFRYLQFFAQSSK